MSNKLKSKFMFVDGARAYKFFDKNYNKHKKGYVILGPPGCGKTTFIKNQSEKKKNWVDADDLLGPNSLNVQWNLNSNNPDDFKLAYMRADYMLEQSKLMGFRIIGSLFWEYKADAMVMPPLKIHKEYVKNRKSSEFKLDPKTLNKMRKLFRNHAKKFKIPIFSSVDDAVKYISSLD